MNFKTVVIFFFRVLVEESMELQSLTSGGRKSENTNSKSILRRMPRVWSDEMASGTDHSDEDPRPISPGIPILNKAKSDKEPRVNESKKCLLSPPPPPPPSTSETARKESANQEVIGAGLPLLQRLLILKQKNDQDVAPQHKPKKSDSDGPECAPKVKSNAKLKTPKKENTKAVSSKQRMVDVHARPRKPTTTTKFWTLLKKATVLTPKAKTQDALKVDSDPASLQLIVKPAAAEFSSTSVSRGCGNKFIVMCQKLDDQYRQGSLIAQNISAHNSLASKRTEHNSIIKEQCDIRIAQRPKVLHLADGTKRRYDSINDLSPEYAGLSFVKKLKILNERQKLAELEERACLRSASLDAAGCEAPDDLYSSRLTRSHSEAVALEVVLRNQKLRKPEPSSAGTPDECNETAERIRLKNILKQLSSKCYGNDRVDQLMNSQTIEGYAARHSKLTRNVTFNQRRTVVESSPDSYRSLYAFPDSFTTPQCTNPHFIPLGSSDKTDVPESSRTALNARQSKRPSATDTVRYSPNRPDIKQHCYDEIVNGVHTVVEKCLVSPLTEIIKKNQTIVLEMKIR